MSKIVNWTDEEKAIARLAYDNAYRAEMTDLTRNVEVKVTQVKDPCDIWDVYNFLSYKKKETERKYDFRYSVLLRVLGQLFADGYVKEEDLVGLSADKIESIIKFSTLWKDED